MLLIQNPMLMLMKLASQLLELSSTNVMVVSSSHMISLESLNLHAYLMS